MKVVNLSNEMLLCTGRIKTPLTRNELVYADAVFDKAIHWKNSLIKHYILQTLLLFC